MFLRSFHNMLHRRSKTGETKRMDGCVEHNTKKRYCTGSLPASKAAPSSPLKQVKQVVGSESQRDKKQGHRRRRKHFERRRPHEISTRSQDVFYLMETHHLHVQGRFFLLSWTTDILSLLHFHLLGLSKRKVSRKTRAKS